MRMQCEAAPTGVSCQVQLPGGQDQHRTSPNNSDLRRCEYWGGEEGVDDWMRQFDS